MSEKMVTRISLNESDPPPDALNHPPVYEIVVREAESRTGGEFIVELVVHRPFEDPYTEWSKKVLVEL